MLHIIPVFRIPNQNIHPQVFLVECHYSFYCLIDVGEMKFSSIEITWMIHATEDGKKVVDKMLELFPLNHDEIKSLDLEGHFGNPILLYKARLIGDRAGEFVQALFSSLSDLDKVILEREVSEHLDEHGAFYIRIDKQLLCEGKIGLSEKEAIRIKLKPKIGSKLHDRLSYWRGLLK